MQEQRDGIALAADIAGEIEPVGPYRAGGDDERCQCIPLATYGPELTLILSAVLIRATRMLIRAKAKMRAKTSEAPRSEAVRAEAYVDIFRLSSVDRIQKIREGVPAVEAKRVLAALTMTQGGALAALNLSAATMNRKAAQNGTLSRDESERVIGVAKLIGQVQAMVEDSGNAEGFDAVGWLARWLEEPLPAFGGKRPIEFLDTIEGQTMVGNAIARMQSGAYA